jgi:hypothetical protein
MNCNFIFHGKKRKKISSPHYHFARNKAVNESNIAIEMEKKKKKRKHKIFDEMTKK